MPPMVKLPGRLLEPLSTLSIDLPPLAHGLTVAAYLSIFARGVLVWRIENFKVVPVPKNLFGQFFNGDSYIVLKVRSCRRWKTHAISLAFRSFLRSTFFSFDFPTILAAFF